MNAQYKHSSMQLTPGGFVRETKGNHNEQAVIYYNLLILHHSKITHGSHINLLPSGLYRRLRLLTEISHVIKEVMITSSRAQHA
jgi:hypothetical protein